MTSKYIHITSIFFTSHWLPLACQPLRSFILELVLELEYVPTLVLLPVPGGQRCIQNAEGKWVKYVNRPCHGVQVAASPHPLLPPPHQTVNSHPDWGIGASGNTVRSTASDPWGSPARLGEPGTLPFCRWDPYWATSVHGEGGLPS